jgi:two-component sensor histidine kinase
MYHLSKDFLHLTVEDNGLGQKEVVENKGTGFGSQLIQLLCQQLNGKMNQQSDSGTKVSFDFPLH